MIGLIAWGAAIVFALCIAGVVAFDLIEHVRRFRDAVTDARIELKPKYIVLTAFPLIAKPSGRHRAEPHQ